MSRSVILIDGYNLMHAAGFARPRYSYGELKRCRDQTVGHLAKLLTPEECSRTTIVFDAQEAAPGSSRFDCYHQLSVHFADPGQEADDYIELWIESNFAGRSIYLVSSDQRLQRAARKRHGRTIGSAEFLQHLAQRNMADLSAEKLGTADKQGAGATAEMDFWLREFGEVDPQELKKELPSEVSESDFLPLAGGPPSAAPAAPGKGGAVRRPGSRTEWEQSIDELQQQLDSPESLDDWLNGGSVAHRHPPKKKLP